MYIDKQFIDEQIAAARKYQVRIASYPGFDVEFKPEVLADEIERLRQELSDQAKEKG